MAETSAYRRGYGLESVDAGPLGLQRWFGIRTCHSAAPGSSREVTMICHSRDRS